MITIDVAQRRARLARRHHLATRAARVQAVATDLVGLHSSDPATVFLAARARTKGFTVSSLETGRYADRRPGRNPGTRPTHSWFVGATYPFATIR